MAIRKIISRSIGVDVIAAEDLAAGSVETAEIQNGAVTGPKLSDNLNYDSGTLYLDSTNNRVGIGTTSPTTALDVTGTVTADGLTVDASGGGLTFSGGGNTFISATSSPLIFQTSSGTERLRITGTGNVGIGTSAPGQLLQVESTSNAKIRLAYDATRYGQIGRDSTGHYEFASYEDGATIKFGTITGSSGSTATRMIINAGGNVGIGVSTAATKLDVRGGTNADHLTLTGTTNRGLKISTYNPNGQNDSGVIYDAQDTESSGYSPAHSFRAGGTEKLLIGSKNAADQVKIFNHTNSGWALNVNNNVATNRLIISAQSGTGSVTHHQFNNSNGLVGSIVTSGSGTTYNTSSDYRLKENVTTEWDATTRLKQLNPVRFNFIADADKTFDGFIAHEVSDVVPEAVTGTKDAMDEDGNIAPQGLDHSKLVPLLVKSLQEALTEIDSLKARLNDAGL